MQHSILIAELGPHGEEMAAAVGSCVHCGFCLPTCPTYVTMGEEMDSPRGRIFIIKEALEGGVELEAALPFVDNCLGCQACETACPSGVRYGDLLTGFREYAEQRRRRGTADRARRELILRTVSHPGRFRLAARLGRLAKPLARFLGPQLSPMLELLPERVPATDRLPVVTPALGTRRARVALLAGCAQQVLAPEINRATVQVLARNGVETVIPAAQGCCGALAMHAGAGAQARALARRNLDAFPQDVDAVITNAAGCGSGIREYPLLFKGRPEHDAAAALAARTVDVSAFLAELGLSAPPPPVGRPLTVAYQDACHLAHAQGVRDAPRALLGAIGGVTVATPAESELCCGSAGIYNLEKPAVASELGARKAAALRATGAELVATGNIGCLTQLRSQLEAGRAGVEVLHTMQVLDRAYAGTLGPRGVD